MRILHVITSLGRGGAETQLRVIAVASRDAGYEVKVVSLLSGGENAELLREAGIDVEDLGMKRGVPTLGALLKLVRIMRQWQPDIVHGWLYYAELMLSVARLFAFRPAMFWNVRCSVLDPNDHPKLLFFIIKLLARWSEYPKGIVVNSQAGIDFHVGLGYQRENWCYIPNAIDTDKFAPSEKKRSEVRGELAITDDTLVVALVARFHAMKDHQGFVASLPYIFENVENVKVVMVGDGVDQENAELLNWIEATDLPSDKVLLLGGRGDVDRLQASWDVAVSSSYSEGFSNTVAEAMSSGVPCVTTDVGDAAWLVGNTGIVVPARNPRALADAVVTMLQNPPSVKDKLGKSARQRILDNYSVTAVVQRYIDIYKAALRQ